MLDGINKSQMKLIVILLTQLICTISIIAGDNDESYRQVIDLKGKWRFMIGDDINRADTSFNDYNWESIMVPSSWENEGFPGYDGYAWYRKQVIIPSNFNTSSLILFLGYIDDVDELFFNGVKIGNKGSFPPNFWTAFDAERKYYIPQELIKFDKVNTIAIRVYDSQNHGGIVSGKVGIFAKQNELPVELNLEGFWKFNTGDKMEWSQKEYDDSNWPNIMVPGYWEDQIIKDHDGFAWYRKQFIADKNMKGKRYVLSLGKIDDLDEVYLNGKLVGSTGTIELNVSKIKLDGEFDRDRYYYLNSDDILPGQKNTISVRVYDGRNVGGIYSGTIGLIELTQFVNYWRKKTNKR